MAIDPFRGYANGVATHLAHAIFVVDPFHAIALANRAVDDVRRRVQQDTLGHRGRSGDPLYGIRRLLLRATERHTDASRARLEAGLAGDPFDEVLDTVLAKEALRWSYAAPDLAEATRRFDTFIAECKSSRSPSSTAWPALPCAGAPRSWPTTAPAPPTAHRGGESHREEGPASGPWLPQLRELSAPGPSPLRRGMAHSSCRTNQGALSPLRRVEPQRTPSSSHVRHRASVGTARSVSAQF